MFVDCHHHFWSVSRGDYGWLSPDSRILWRDYLPADLAPQLQRHGITETVLVQAAPSIAETDYLLGLADATPWVRAVVGWIDFDDPTHLVHLRRWARQPKFRAVRPMLQDTADTGWILAPQRAWAFDALSACNLHFEFLGTPRHLDTSIDLCSRYPDLNMIINHGLKPDIANGQIDVWTNKMTQLAQMPNAICKLSGLVTEARHGWTLLDLKPYVDHIVSSFGPDRVMWGSDWPVVNRNGSYDAWRAVTLALTGAHPNAHQILGDTARRIYRMI